MCSFIRYDTYMERRAGNRKKSAAWKYYDQFLAEKEPEEDCSGSYLSALYDWERLPMETRIWKSFEDGNWSLMDCMPYMKYYNGMAALKRMVKTLPIPSIESVRMARLLYEHTGKEKYLDIIMWNMKRDPDEKAYVHELSACSPCARVYTLLKRAYIKSGSDDVRWEASVGLENVLGALWNRDRSEMVKIGKALYGASSENARRTVMSSLEHSFG